MNLDRGLIKNQARALIKNKVMKLFLTFFIITLCTNIAVEITTAVTSGRSAWNSITSNEYDDAFSGYGDNDFNYYDDFDLDESQNDFNSFGANLAVPARLNTASAGTEAVTKSVKVITYVFAVLLAPLSVALAAYFVEFIRGREYEFGAGLKSIFHQAFSVKYWNKVGGALIKSALEYALSICLIFPGVIFHYSSYFTYQIMCDYPELSPWQAIKLSKKIVEGNRTELFVLDLSFIPWYLLCIFVFPIIYVMPYVQTTQALYYENFRLRAIQTGRVTEDDFLSDEQKLQKYSNTDAPFENGAEHTYGNDYSASPSANPSAQPQQSNAAQPSYFTPAVQNVQQPAYYTPTIPKKPDPEQPVDIYTPMTEDTVNPPEKEPVPQIKEADVVLTQPEEPITPELIEPQDAFVEEQTPREPKPLTDDGSDVDL